MFLVQVIREIKYFDSEMQNTFLLFRGSDAESKVVQGLIPKVTYGFVLKF